MSQQRIVKECYEVPSPSFNDLSLDKQIEYGINDWKAVDADGREFFGQSRAKAIAAALIYNS